VAEETMRESLAFQRVASEMSGSPLMARLLDAVLGDFDAGGVCAELLGARTERPLRDGVPLRLMGAVHRLVLEGRAPRLAAYYPSVGGGDTGDPGPALLATIAEHRDAVVEGLGRGVQTNEVGRAAALVGGFAEVARRTGLPLRTLEVGASGGLLLRWDHYGYDTRRAFLGDPASALQFTGVWDGEPPDLAVDAFVATRRGCDVAPIDAGTDEGRLTLLSFVWPDQLDRIGRLRAALEVAARQPVAVDVADAGWWAAEQLAVAHPGVATVLYHSIVLQYLDRASFEGLRGALYSAGEAATDDAPLAWLRMEPAGAVADVRLTMWPGGQEEVLATCGYHGQAIRWGG
jgi:hypothetical protein